MTERPLKYEEALAEALAALDEIPTDGTFRLVRADFGEFARGGIYWSIVASRQWGNTQDVLNARERDVDRDRLTVIRAYHEHLSDAAAGQSAEATGT